jgi:hypothetical protein
MHGRSEEGRDKFAGAGLALLAERARLIIFRLGCHKECW